MWAMRVITQGQCENLKVNNFGLDGLLCWKVFFGNSHTNELDI